MKSLQCSFSENVLYYQGILQIGRFILQDFYRIPVDNELVAWSCSNTKWKVSAFQQSRPRRVANCHVCDTCQGEKKWKSPHTCGTNYVYYPRSVLALGYRRCLRLYVRPCVNHELVIMITRDSFKLRSPNLDQRYKTTWLCISWVNPHILTTCMYNFCHLTHWGWKMADFSQMTYSNAYLDENFWIWIGIYCQGSNWL